MVITRKSIDAAIHALNEHIEKQETEQAANKTLQLSLACVHFYRNAHGIFVWEEYDCPFLVHRTIEHKLCNVNEAQRSLCLCATPEHIRRTLAERTALLKELSACGYACLYLAHEWIFTEELSFYVSDITRLYKDGIHG